ncbi:VOC family protein [Photobacterium sanguinicancri]|uniref:VOC family protein n=1 Tax=Photobacterium sanguinicancri TaxID=875932 RepID=UPI000787FB9E|nr:VOC family protein [Photobacterium sanguinicancri]KXI21660.1 hypothetical protein AS132_18510 [Photobacterium sanguinicancri]
MNNVFQQQGAFSWSELIVDNPEEAVKFYQDVIGWEVEAMEMPQGVYHVVKSNGEPVGGIMAKPPGAEKMPNYWGCYITVENVDETIAKAEAAGGKAVYPAMDVPGVGRMCALFDVSGAIISVITYEKKEC